MLTIFGKKFIFDAWHSSEYACQWDFKNKKKRNNYFPGWGLCLANAYFLHWLQAICAYKHSPYKEKKHVINTKQVPIIWI